jgi:hypothetical protein
MRILMLLTVALLICSITAGPVTDQTETSGNGSDSTAQTGGSSNGFGSAGTTGLKLGNWCSPLC